MAVEYTDSQLDSMSKDELKFVILTLQAQLKDLIKKELLSFSVI